MQRPGVRPKTIVTLGVVAVVVSFMIWQPFNDSGRYYPADVTSNAQHLAELDGGKLAVAAPYANALYDLTSKCTQDAAGIADLADSGYRDLETHSVLVYGESRLTVLQNLKSWVADAREKTDCQLALTYYVNMREGLPN